jgi:hypothetical protein
VRMTWQAISPRLAKQAASFDHVSLDLLLPGVEINTDPSGCPG